MAFDIKGAKEAGYSDNEIVDFLGAENKFDTVGAREAGYSDEELMQHLIGTQQPQEESDADKAARAEGKLIPEGESTLTSMGQAGIGALKSTVGGISQFIPTSATEQYGKEFAQAGAEQGKYYPSIGDLPALYREKGLGTAASRLIPALGYDVARTAPIIAGGIGAGALATALAPEAAVLGIGAEALASTGVYGLAATGENMNVQQRQIDEGTRKDFDRGYAAAAGMVSGVLERVGVQQILGKAGRVGESVARKIGLEAGTAGEQALAASERTALARVGRAAAGTVGTAVNEAGIETAQEALTRAQAGQSLTDEQAREAYLGSALGGFTMGGALHAPVAAYQGVKEQGKADTLISALGADGFDVLNPDVNKPLTKEQFNEYGSAMAEGMSRMTAQEDGSRLKTPEQYYEELKNKVANPERDAETARIKARTPGEGIEDVSQTQLEDEFAKGYEGPKQEQDLDIDAQKLEINKQAEAKYNDIRNEFLNGSLKGTDNKPVTSAAEANKIAIKEKNDHLKFNMELLNEEVESRNKRQEDIFGYKPTTGDLSTDQTLPVNTEGEVLTAAEAEIRADAQHFRRLAEKQHEDLVAAGIESAATKEMSALLAKTKQGTQADLFGGKKGTLKEEPFTEEAKDYGTEPKQTDIEDEAKRLEVANLTARLRGLTKPIEGGPHPDILLGITPTTQQKVTDFKTAVHAEVGAKDDAVVTPEHIKAAGITGLELGNLVDKSGALPLTDKRVVEGINKLAPAKQQALINVLSKDYKPKNYISPSEQLISQADILNLGVGKQSVVGKLVPTPTSTINVLSNPKAAQQVINNLNKIIGLPANKGTETAVKATELKDRIALTLAKVESTAKTTAGVTKTKDVTKDKVAYSVAPSNATTGHTVLSLGKTLTPEMRRLVESGKAVLHDTQATLPGENHPANVQGMTTADGVTHYVANKLTPESMQNVALHEVGVHAGMEKMLGAKMWEDVKNQAMTNQGKEFVRARAAVPKGTPANLRAEETLAYLVENSRHLPLVRRIIAAIRNWARTTFGANIKLTEADARQLAVTSMRRESKTAERTARKETAFSKGELLAPNGKPSKLNSMQYAQVRTPEFKKWFGDWENDPANASKVVDENGEPLVVYRGYGEENPDINSYFTWVSENKKLASGYAENRSNPTIAIVFVKTEAPFNLDHDNRRFSPREFVSEAIKLAPNKLDKDKILNARAEFLDYFKNMYRNPEAVRGVSEYWGKDEGKVVTRGLLTSLGYDGIQLSERTNTSSNFPEAMTWATFNPNQVKSATGNTGAFSTENDDIRYSTSSENVPPLSNPKVKAKWQRILNNASEKRAPLLHMFSSAGLKEVAGEYLPQEQAAKVLRLTRTIQGKVNKKLDEYMDIRKNDINTFIKKYHAKIPIINEVATEATLLGVALNMEGNNIQTKIDELKTQQPKGYVKDIARLNRLATSWSHLGGVGKKTYVKLAAYYRQSHEDHLNALIANIESANVKDAVTDARIAKLREQLADSKLAGDYFPLQRFGNFGMEYTDGEVDEDTGERIKKFTKFESRNEGEDFLAAHPEVVSKGINKDFDREHLATGNKTLQDMFDTINKSISEEQGGMSAADLIKVKNELKDMAFQMHLMGKPEQSIAKRFLHRKGTAGYSTDIFRGFDTYALSMAKQLPLIESSHTITVALDELKKEVSKNPSDAATDYYSAFRREIEEAVYPKPVSVGARTLTAAAFMYYLTSPASAVFQLVSIPIMGMPSIAKKHGMAMAQGVLNATSTMYIASMGKGNGFGDIKKGAALNTDIQKLFKGATHANEADIGKAVDQMREEALLVPGLHAQTFSGKNKPTGHESNLPTKAYELMERFSQPFAQMEKASREIVGVASYIANIRSGMTHAEAVRDTIDTLYVDMGDFGETGRSSLSKTTLGRIAGQFQQYGAKLLFAMYKHAYLDMTKEVGRAQARKYIAQLYLMHYIFAGALGMPLVGFAGMVADLFGDDDERQSFKDDIRSYLHEKNLNDTVIKLILDGPIGTVTHLDLTPRIGASDLIPILQESNSNTSTSMSTKDKIFQALGGASFGLFDTIDKATQSFSAGEYARAIENLLPAAPKNLLMAGRYAIEGKKNAKGEDVISKKDIGTWDVIARALGVETSDIAEKTRAARAVTQDVKFIADRRNELFDKLAKAEGDERQKILKEMIAFGIKHPGAAIRGKDVISSAKSRAKYKATGISGAHPGKNLPEEQRKHPELFYTENDYPYENED